MHYKEIEIIWDGDLHEIMHSTRFESEMHQQQLVEINANHKERKKTKYIIKRWCE